MSAYTPAVHGTGAKATVQRVGAFLASMVMPNIAAFIAWGLITALFIPAGWLPNEHAAKLVGPIITYLLPILIGYTGGRIVHGQRGAVVAAVATMGVIVGTDVPMFLGAMIIGPLTALILKYIDGYVQERTKIGFEMLVDNFTAGILGGAMALAGLWGIGPVVERLTNAAGDVVEYLVDHHLLPFAAVVIEPAKVLFLNNAINHGILGPLGSPRPPRRASRSCSCWRPTRVPASACCSPSCSSARARCAPRCRPRSSSSSSAASTRSTSRTS